ncbi:MAG: hypothetical protein AAGD22_10065 [Verrucomicrobiota bacterium]
MKRGKSGRGCVYNVKAIGMGGYEFTIRVIRDTLEISQRSATATDVRWAIEFARRP